MSCTVEPLNLRLLGLENSAYRYSNMGSASSQHTNKISRLLGCYKKNREHVRNWWYLLSSSSADKVFQYYLPIYHRDYYLPNLHMFRSLRCFQSDQIQSLMKISFKNSRNRSYDLELRLDNLANTTSWIVYCHCIDDYIEGLFHLRLHPPRGASTIWAETCPGWSCAQCLIHTIWWLQDTASGDQGVFWVCANQTTVAVFGLYNESNSKFVSRDTTLVSCTKCWGDLGAGL